MWMSARIPLLYDARLRAPKLDMSASVTVNLAPVWIVTDDDTSDSTTLTWIQLVITFSHFLIVARCHQSQ